MVSWDDPRVLVAIYAAIVGTISLIWNITNHIINKKRKLKVIYKHNQKFNNIMGAGFYPFTAILIVEATNIGNEGLHIKTVTLKFRNKKIKLMGKMTNELSFIDPTGRIKYPYYLGRGEIFKDVLPVKNILGSINEQLFPNDKICFFLEDTLGKKYKSQYFKYGTLFDLVEEEKLLNEKSNQAREKNFYGSPNM